MNEPAYLDYAATTPLDDGVLRAMLPYFSETFGNPSSVHAWGRAAEDAVEDARADVAALLGARADEIIFTACGTESDNLALRGVALAQAARGKRRILTTAVEHYAVLQTAHQLADQFGFSVDLLPVDEFGRVDPADLARALAPDVALVSIIYANNEIGTLNDMPALGELCRAQGVPLHSDAVQAAAHLKMDVERDRIDLLSIGAHKFYGPKGVGALYVRRGTPILPIQTGGAQEHSLRAGTQNVPYIVGLRHALRLAQEGVAAHAAHTAALRDRIIARTLEEISGARLTGHPVQRLPNHAGFVFEDLDGNLLLQLLDAAGFACSSGSACKSGSPKPSGALLALGIAPALALGSLRVTVGRDTTPAQVDAFCDTLAQCVSRARALGKPA